jgi:5'(3')-deoxyribonucleotidase
MKKGHLFFDFDGMLVDTLQSTVDFINHYYGTKIQVEDIAGRGSELELVIQEHKKGKPPTRDEFYRLFGAEYLPSPRWHKDVRPMPHADKILSLLAKKYEIHIVTARQSHGKNVIEDLVEDHFNGCVDYTHCVWTRDNKDEFVKTAKSSYIEQVDGIKIAFFDDSPHEVHDVSRVIPSFLFDPSNHFPDFSPSGKVTSWKEIGEIYL